MRASGLAGEYLDAFAACRRGASDTGSLPWVLRPVRCWSRRIAVLHSLVERRAGRGDRRSSRLMNCARLATARPRDPRLGRAPRVNSACGLAAARHRGSGTTAPRSPADGDLSGDRRRGRGRRISVLAVQEH